MRQRPELTLEDAKAILAAAEQCAAEHRLPVCIAICDDSGALLLLARRDGARAQTARLAADKARCAATSHRPTAFWGSRLKENPQFAAFPDMCALAGGVPIFSDEHCVGGIGISGAKGPGEDELVANAGIAALNTL